MDNEKYIASAVADFEKILREQLARNEKMKSAPPATDYAVLDKIVIGCCGGDGIGPIITAEARRVLEALLTDEIAAGRVELRDIEGLTIENRLAAGKAIPDDVLAAIRGCNVVLKGPTTTPQGGTGAKELESANVAMRRELDLFANVRPVSIPAEGIDARTPRANTCSAAAACRFPASFHATSRSQRPRALRVSRVRRSILPKRTAKRVSAA